MGIDQDLITADEVCYDKDGSLFADTGLILTTQPAVKVGAPEHTDIQAGLETFRVRTQHATMVRCTLSSIAVLLIKMAGERKSILTANIKNLRPPL